MTAIVWLAAAACFPSVTRAQDTLRLQTSASPEQERREQVPEGWKTNWLSNASCVSCHFQVPHQTAPHRLDAKLAKKGYLTGKLYDQKKDLRCANCHQATVPPQGQCARVEGCLRNAANQKKVTYLGVSVGAVPPAVRQHVKLPNGVGLMIESVEADSPAAKAELREYDLLERIDRQLLVNQQQFSVLIKTYPPDDEVSLELVRANEPKTLRVKLGERVVEDSVAQRTQGVAELQAAAAELIGAQADVLALRQIDLLVRQDAQHRQAGLVTYLGINTSPPPDALAEQLRLPQGLCLVIDSIEADSPAAAAGLRPFDVLQKLDDQLLVNAEQLTVLIRNYHAGEEVELTLIRDGQPLKLRAKLAEHQVGDANKEQGAVYAVDDLVVNVELDNARLVETVEFSMRPGDVKDEEYARRVYLDLTGTLPARQELADFVSDDSPNKRQRLVYRMLSRPEVIDKIAGGAVLQWSDGEHSLVFTTTEAGEKRLLAKDKQGNILFDGPVNTDGQRQQLGPRLAAKLELMLKGLAAVPADEAPADTKAGLERVLPRFQADEETLAQLLDRLRRETGLNIVVDRKALAASGVKLDEPLSLDLHDVRARSVLTTLLALAGGPNVRLRHDVEDGVVLISTAR